MVYENEKVFAFMDRHPINLGHVPVIPKSHMSNHSQLAEDEYI